MRNGVKLCMLASCLVTTVYPFAQSEKINIKGQYFGEKPPGMTAIIFATGIISTDSIEHSSPAFSPDGKLVLWTKIYSGKPAFIVEMKQVGGTWTNLHAPSFANLAFDDFYPSFSVDGKELFFSSRRPLPHGYPKNQDMWIWKVERNNNGWGTPRPLDSTVIKGFEYAHSVSKKGTIFFSSRRPGTRDFDIFFAKCKNNKFLQAEILNDSINTAGYEDGPFIAPDESYLIFESQRPESFDGSIDLYICFRQKNGSWTKPKNMGPRINTKYSERFATVSPDGKYLFFGSNRQQLADNLYFDIYWIDARIVDQLKNEVLGDSN
jgi:Tol biopolymer transport system component